MVVRGSFGACLSLVALALAGCADASDAESGDALQAAATAAKPAAVQAIGNEPYRYESKKKKSAATVEAPVVVPGKEHARIVVPQNAKRPEVVAHVKQFSDSSVKYNGAYTEFSSDGTAKHAEGEFRDDLRDGTWKYFHPNGQPAKEVTYRDGKLDGKWTLHNDDGTKKFEVAYKNGLRDGQWSYFSKADKDGKQFLLRTEEWKSGILDGRLVQFHATGQKGREITFKQNKIDGKEVRWYPSGKKYSEIQYENGLPNGTLTIWDEAGKAVIQREYRDGKPLGTASGAQKSTANAK